MLHIVYWHWLVLGLILLSFDAFAGSMTVLWFGVAALFIAALAYIAPSIHLGILLLLWVLVALVLALGWFKVFRPKRAMQQLEISDVKGEWATLISLPQAERAGKLRFAYPIKGASEWQCRAAADENLSIGDRIYVEAIEADASQVLIVKKHQNQP